MQITINIPPGATLDIAAAECGTTAGSAPTSDPRRVDMMQMALKAASDRIAELEAAATEHATAAERAAKVEDLARRMIGWTHKLGGGNWVQFENGARELGVIS